MEQKIVASTENMTNVLQSIARQRFGTHSTRDLVPVYKYAYTGTIAVGKKRLEICTTKNKARETPITDKCTRYAPSRLTEEDRNGVKNHITHVLVRKATTPEKDPINST
jgi:hypothetical protein